MHSAVHKSVTMLMKLCKHKQTNKKHACKTLRMYTVINAAGNSTKRAPSKLPRSTHASNGGANTVLFVKHTLSVNNVIES